MQQHLTMYPKNKFEVIYKFDQTIPDWERRLANAYQLLFKKIDEMEIEQRLRKKGNEKENYGNQQTVQL